MLRSSRIIERGKEMRWKKDGMVGTSGRGQRCMVRVRIGSEGRSSVGIIQVEGYDEVRAMYDVMQERQ